MLSLPSLYYPSVSFGPFVFRTLPLCPLCGMGCIWRLSGGMVYCVYREASRLPGATPYIGPQTVACVKMPRTSPPSRKGFTLRSVW